jgi:putative tryptophan/tyrosine transport system substrate-binding protein
MSPIWIGRREFINLVGGTAGFWPVVAPRALAQQAVRPVVGFVQPGVPEAAANVAAAYRKGLSESGYDEGRNLSIEYRWAHNELSRLPDLIADLVRRRVNVIATLASGDAAFAAKTATTTIPIIFTTGADPVQIGLVASLNRPGGNLTGISTMSAELGSKRLGLLHELLPNATRFAALINPNQPDEELLTADIKMAATAMGLQVELFRAGTPREIEQAFVDFARNRPDALLVVSGSFFTNRRVQISTLVARHGLPAIYGDRQYVEVGGMMSYGPSATDSFRQAGIYTARLLKGEKPAELPILRATKFELVINMPTIRAFGLTVPPTLLAIADEVIE